MTIPRRVHSHGAAPLASLGSSRASALSLLLVMVAGVSGCGHSIYAVRAGSAHASLEEAKSLGAEKLAPYEYYYAREHLTKAEREAAEADYQDAIELSKVSETYSQKAIRIARDARAATKANPEVPDFDTPPTGGELP